MRKIYLAAWVAIVGLLITGPSFADDPPTLAKMWKITPKPGMSDALKSALKVHAGFRTENGDPWNWNMYQLVTGEMDGSWCIRSPGHTWAEMDSYQDDDFSEKALTHWNATVSQFVAGYEASISRLVPEISNWPEGATYTYYWVFTYHVRPGKNEAFKAAAQAITDVLKAEEWDEIWAFTEGMTGDSKTFSLVRGEDGYAGFAGPGTTAFDAVAAAKGQEAATAMWTAFTDTFKRVESQIYRREADMSVVAGGK